MLGDEFDVEDEVGLWRNHRRAALFSIGKLVGDEETALAADMHPLEALVPSDDDALEALRELEGLAAVER